MTSVAPTWIVLARDVSESVVVSGQRRTVVAAVLDVVTGMVVNITSGASSEDVLRRALKGALVKPAVVAAVTAHGVGSRSTAIAGATDHSLELSWPNLSDDF